MPNRESYKVSINRQHFFRCLKRHGFTEAKIAEAIGVSSKTIQRAVTSGKINPYYLEQIASIIHEDPNYISGIRSLQQEPCEDAISRSDMLDAVGHGMTYTSEELQKIIKGLPSVNAQQKYEDIAKAFQFGMAFGFGEKHNKMDKVINEITKVITPQPKTGYWISVSERLPDDFGTYLITLENGDVCNCEFNPDFIDEEHENGAFTYYHQYFDNATLAIGEEEAVDAIAWMPFEPYEPQEREVSNADSD